MKITKKRLKRIIKEEFLREGIHRDGLMEILVDTLKNELGSWHPEAKAEAYEELASKGLDLTKIALNILDDEAGRNPGGTIGEAASVGSLDENRQLVMDYLFNLPENELIQIAAEYLGEEPSDINYNYAMEWVEGLSEAEVTEI